MSNKRSRAADYLIYLAVRAFVAIMQALSLRAACRLADGLAWVLYHVNKRHRLVALENLRYAFPEMDEQTRDRTVRGVYRHFCLLLVEIIQMPRVIQTTNWHEYLDLRGGPKIVDQLLGKRAVLLVTGHFGNWEMAGYALGLFGFKTFAIARTLDNPFLNDFLLYKFRSRTGQTILDKSGDFERIQGVLANRGVLATLADQDAGQRGQFVEFFGRPASTHKAVALLSLEFDAPMLIVGTPRVGGPFEYCCLVEEVIDPRDYQGRSDAVRVMTQRYTSALEGLVRRYPEQYFWLHRRWKHQPKERKSRAA